MPTNEELRAATRTGTANAEAAGKVLADYYTIYYAELNAVLKARHQVDSALFDETHALPSPSVANEQALKTLLFDIDSRLDDLDKELTAFQGNQIRIRPPTDAQIDDVKKASAAVSQIQVKASAVDSIRTALTNLLGLIGNIHSK